MIRLIEGAMFLALATGIHVGLWAAAPPPDGAVGGGDTGEQSLTLHGATASHAALVARWTAPPQVSEQITPVAAPAPMVATPAPSPAIEQQPQLERPDRPALPDAGSAPRAEITPPSAPRAAPQTDLAQPAAPDVTPRRDATVTADRKPPRAMPQAPRAPQVAQAPQPDTAAATPRPKVTAKPSAPAQPKARAAGNNPAATTKAKRTDGGAQTAGTSSAKANALQAKWGARIQRKVHRNLHYPSAATGNGTARVALTVDRTGRLRGVRIVRSSGVAAFDKAALAAVQRAGRFPKAPSELTQASYSFTLALSFKR